MLKAGDDNFAAPRPARAGRAVDGHIVALAAAGGKVDLIAAAVQRFGNAGAGRLDGVLRGHGRVVQAAGVRPKLRQGRADGLCHRRVNPSGGGVIEIMQLGVGKHTTHSSHFTQSYTG